MVTLLYVVTNYFRFALLSSLCVLLRASLNASRFAIAINSRGFASVMCCSFARLPLFAFPTSLLFVRANV